jgi:hypothetical protein
VCRRKNARTRGGCDKGIHTKKKTNRKAGFIPIKKTKMNDLFFLNFVFALILNDASSISTNGAGIRYIEQMLECYILCFHIAEFWNYYGNGDVIVDGTTI